MPEEQHREFYRGHVPQGYGLRYLLIMLKALCPTLLFLAFLSELTQNSVLWTLKASWGLSPSLASLSGALHQHCSLVLLPAHCHPLHVPLQKLLWASCHGGDTPMINFDLHQFARGGKLEKLENLLRPQLQLHYQDFGVFARGVHVSPW